MSEKEVANPACSLCQCRYSSTALNKKEKNKKRPVEKQSREIYEVILTRLASNKDNAGHTCTYCRDVLRSLIIRSKVVNGQLLPEVEEELKKGVLFPRRNLKRQGTNMSRKNSGKGKPQRSLPESPKPAPFLSQDTSASNCDLFNGATATEEPPSTQLSMTQESFYAAGDLVDVDESFIRQSSLEKSLSIKHSQEQSTPNERNDNLTKKRKLDIIKTQEEIVVSSMESTTTKENAFRENSTSTVKTESLLFARLCDIHQMLSSKTLENKPKSEEWPGHLIIPEIMSLWKITKLPIVQNVGDLHNLPAAVTAISGLLEFLNTGKSIIPFQEADSILHLLKGRVVNDYVVGLLMIETFRDFAPGSTCTLKKNVTSSSKGGVISKFISLKEQSLPHETLVMTMYEMISTNGHTWNESYIFDGQSKRNYDCELKQFFYYWLYHQVALLPACSVTQILLSRMEIGKTITTESEGIIKLHFIDKTTSEIESVSIHSLLLMLLQKSDPSSMKTEGPMIRLAFGKLRINKTNLVLLFKMLYRPEPVTDQSSSPLQQIPSLDVVDVMLALGVQKPIELFYTDFAPTSPYTFKLALCFYIRTNDLSYLSEMLIDPFQCLNLDNATLLEPSELKFIVMLDEMAFDEKKLYDFILDYSNLVGGADESKITETRNLLLPFVRFALMTTEEFNQVNKNDGFFSENEILKIWLHITSSIKPDLPDRFWKPSIRRSINN